MSLFELKIEIPTAAAEAADAVLLDFGSENWSVLENAIAQRAWVVGLGADGPALRREWTEIEERLRATGISSVGVPEPRALGDADWRDSYKAHFRAWQFGPLHWVPVWQRSTFRAPPAEKVLWLDPGLAFGTGNHETTRLCCERLVALAEPTAPTADGLVAEVAKNAPRRARRRVIDAGCGSGILALSAALLGFEDIVGFDHDPDAVRVSEQNAAANGLAGRVHFFVADLAMGLAGRLADILLANIQADVLVRSAGELVAAVAPGGVLVLGGILAQENAQVRTAFAAAAPDWNVSVRIMGEWSDLALVRSA